jgi:hypothetical protein
VNTQHQQALNYIRNANGSPKIEHFDEDHDPVGPRLRDQMKTANLIYERDGRVMLVPQQNI